MTDAAPSPSWTTDDLHVDFGELRARVVTVHGEKWPVTILFDSHDHSDGAPILGERLDEPIDYIPCRMGDSTCLLHLDRMAFIELADEGAEVSRLEAIGASPEKVSLNLINGIRLVGSLMIEGDASHRRVSDYLNNIARRFVLVKTMTGVKYVHRDAIARVDFEEAS